MDAGRTNFMPAPAQLRDQRSHLLALVGRRLRAGWTGWAPETDVWHPAIPLVLGFDGDVQLEIAWQGWDALSITWGAVDLGTPPAIAGRPHEWRASRPQPLAAVAGRTLTGWAVTESPYFPGEADLTGELPMDEVAGWFTQGLWLQFGGAGLHVYNAADANGISAEPVLSGPTRVHHQLPVS